LAASSARTVCRSSESCFSNCSVLNSGAPIRFDTLRRRDAAAHFWYTTQVHDRVCSMAEV
jgi:hypothetical protein